MAKEIRLGYKKCPKWLRERYIKEAHGQCKICLPERFYESLEFHRIKRGNKGGLYTICNLDDKKSNVMSVCKKHHKLLHAKEPGCRNA